MSMSTTTDLNTVHEALRELEQGNPAGALGCIVRLAVDAVGGEHGAGAGAITELIAVLAFARIVLDEEPGEGESVFDVLHRISPAELN